MAKSPSSLPGNSRQKAALLDQGAACFSQGRYQDALAVAAQALAGDPANGMFLNLAGASAFALGLADLAKQYLQQAVAVRPNYAEAHYNLATVWQKLNRFEEAEAGYRSAIAIKPSYAEARNSLGLLLIKRQRFAEAEACLRKLLKGNAKDASVYYHLGMALAMLNRFEEAEVCYRRSLAARPDNVDARVRLGVLLLSGGRFEEGWRHYESRYRPGHTEGKAAPPDYDFPQWQGESLAGKAILVLAEQGFGDELQFCRYVPLLKKLGAGRITLVCQPPLKSLLATLADADEIAVAEEIAGGPKHDCWTFLLSLPLRCKTTLDTIPASLPYLRASSGRVEQWAARLPREGLRVGLAWKGSEAHQNDLNRSLPGLKSLAPLWEHPGIAFVSLQKGRGEKEGLHPPPGQPVTHLGSDIREFADTAAIVSRLDLVICVDTAVAHLAGALGKPCWVMLPYFGTDWRWLRGRADSPWYPGAIRLFRQQSDEGWASVVDEISRELGVWRQDRLPAAAGR